MKRLNSEEGRSMVEMLGVLAIIGVLSVISIYGYRQAMIKMKANEVVNFASLFFAQAAVANGGMCSAGTSTTDFGMTGQGLVPSTVVVTVSSCPSGSAAGSISITGVGDADVCNAVKATIGSSGPVMTIASTGCS